MKIITIASTRPEIIRLSLIIKKLDEVLGKNHIFIHTKQNFTKELHDQFFNDLNLRRPDFELNPNKLSGYKFGGQCMEKISKILSTFNPKKDKILILGDVNGAFYSAYVAKKLGFKIYHMEAGNRCFNEKVPEEINRKTIDNFSYKLLTYTQRSKENLINEGYNLKDILVVGNPIFEVIKNYENKEKNKKTKKYILVTFHRNENVTNLEILKSFVKQLNKIALKENIEIYLSVHPKLKDMLSKWNGIIETFHKNIIINKPFKFKEFIELEKKAKCVITDSGTIPEECSIFNTPCILLRDSTERPELLEVNQMIVTGIKKMLKTYNLINKFEFNNMPKEYDKKTSEIVCKILIGEL